MVTNLKTKIDDFCDRLKSHFLSGNCDCMTDEEFEKWAESAIPFKYIPSDKAAEYLGVDRNMFYAMRYAGIISGEIKFKGSKAIYFSKESLDETKKMIESTPKNELKQLILEAKIKKYQNQIEKLKDDQR